MNTVKEALHALARGKMVLVQDASDREDEGDLVMSAAAVQAADINFMLQHARGMICLAQSKERWQQLGVPLMTSHNQANHQTPFTVAIEAANGVSTGVSAADRALSCRVAAQPQAQPHDIVMPGHIAGLQAQPHGLLVRRGHTEASVDLMKLAGLTPAAVICEVMNADGTMARDADLARFCQQHAIIRIHIDDILRYRWLHEPLIEHEVTVGLPVRESDETSVSLFTTPHDAAEHVVLSRLTGQDEIPTVRLHSACLTGDVFGSLRCDCGQQLEKARQRLAKEDGLILYLPQEGRGIGLVNKLKSYALQSGGMDTIEANEALGFAADERDYAVAAQLLRYFNLPRIRLLSNNPDKARQLQQYGIDVVEQETIAVPACQHNRDYLLTKKNRFNHHLVEEEIL